MVYPNFKLRKETTHPFLEWDPLKSSGFTLPQDMRAKSCSRPDWWRRDEWVWSQSSNPPLSELYHRLLETETEMTPFEPTLCSQEEDGWLPFSVSSVYDWGWIHTLKQTLNPSSRMNEFFAWLRWIFRTQKEKIIIFCWAVWSYFLNSVWILHLSVVLTDYVMFKSVFLKIFQEYSFCSEPFSKCHVIYMISLSGWRFE